MTNPQPNPSSRLDDESVRKISQNMYEYGRMIDQVATAVIDCIMKDVRAILPMEKAVMQALRKRPDDPGCPPSFSSLDEATVYKLYAEATLRERIDELMKHVSPLLVASFIDIGFCEMKRRVLGLALSAGSVDILLQP